MRRALILPAVLVIAAIAPASASAELPTPKSMTIVPGTSIAGVSVGMSVKRALGVWGAGSTCTEESVRTSCYWRGTERQGMASFDVGPTGKVTVISIVTGRKGNGLVYAGPLQKWRTRRKIRLGVTAYAVVKAYPKVRGSGSGPQLGSGNHTTTFQTSSGRIYQISVGVAY